MLWKRLKRKLAFIVRWIRQIVAWKRADYYFISFPKQGRTWFRLFLARYYTHARGVPVDDRFNQYQGAGNNIPRIFFEHRGFWTGLVGKSAKGTMSLEHIQKNISELRGKRVVLLVRDPRDTVISHYFSVLKRSKNEALAKKMEGVTISEFIRMPGFGIEHVIEYMNMWYEARKTFGDFHLVRYEDARTNPQETFRALLRFLRERIDETALDRAIEETRFENMKKKERSGKSTDPRLRPGAKHDEESYKVRKGKVGGYREYLTTEDIAYVNRALKQLHPDFRYSHS